MFATLYVKLVALAGPPSLMELTLTLLAYVTAAAITRDPFFIVCAAQGAGWLE